MQKSVLAIGFDLPDVDGFETARVSDRHSLLDADVIAVELSVDEFGRFGFTPCTSMVQRNHDAQNGLQTA